MEQYEIDDVISGDSARDSTFRNLLECCSCNDLINSETEDYENVVDSIWCIQCLSDADLLAYRYG